MYTVNIHEAKTHLSELITQAMKGEPFIIAKAGKPQVLVTRLDALTVEKKQRLGFMQGQMLVPDDFDHMASDVIVQLFGDD